MKGCLILTGETGIIIHELAGELQRRHGVENFCVIAQTPALKEHGLGSGLPVSNILVEKELRDKASETSVDPTLLASLEKTYGLPFLWPYLIGEKSIMFSNQAGVIYSYVPSLSHEEMQKLLQVFLKSFGDFFEKERPDFIVTVGVGSLGTRIAYELAHHYGIQTIDIQAARIQGRIIITEDFRRFTGVEDLFQKIKNGTHTSPFENEAKKFLEEFRLKPSTYAPSVVRFGIHSKFLFLSPANLSKSIRMITQSIARYLVYFFRKHPEAINPLVLLWALLKKRWRSTLSPFLSTIPNGQDTYAFFALNVDLESVLPPLSPYYTNQMELARSIARSLPFQWKLYVKDHPMMAGLRKFSYYKKLLRIPNVTLIREQIPGFQLVERSQVVLTSAGTIGWEGVLLGKPVITFGDIFYNVLSTVERCTSIEDLPRLINEARTSFKPQDKELIQFLSALFEDSIPFDLIGFMNIHSDREAVKKLQTSEALEHLGASVAQKLKKRV